MVFEPTFAPTRSCERGAARRNLGALAAKVVARRCGGQAWIDPAGRSAQASYCCVVSSRCGLVSRLKKYTECVGVAGC